MRYLNITDISHIDYMTLNEYLLLMEGYVLKAKDEYRAISLQAFRTAQAMNLDEKTSFEKFVGESEDEESVNKIISKERRVNS